MGTTVYNSWALITPSDTVDLPWVTQAIWVGSPGGVVVAVLPDNSVVSFKGLNIGTLLPVAAKRINATGTTAGELVALREV
jgi:hypothetical protein